MNGSVGTNAEGAEAPAPRCNIYNCPREATHTVHLPASTAERPPPAMRRAATVRLCTPCHSDWRENPNPDRLRGNIDLVRARPPQPDGTEPTWRAEESPALALVGDMMERVARLYIETAALHGDLRQLVPLLEGRDAAAVDTAAVIEQCALMTCPEWRQNHSDCIVWAEKPCAPCRARALKGVSDG